MRCDTHGAYYAALMDKHDPLLLRDPSSLGLTDRGDSWMRGGAYFYHYTHYSDSRLMTVPFVNGFRITKMWDPNPVASTMLSKIFYGKAQVCKRPEEASDDVDMVFLADCNGDGSDHRKLAEPGLRKGVPTFVDKPFACDVKDAVAMVDLARKRRTPLMSLSILRTVPHFTRFRARFAELGALHFGSVEGGGTTFAGQIHTINIAQHLFGSGVVSVQSMGKEPMSYMHLDYGGRKDRPLQGVTLNCLIGTTPHCAFYASAYGPEGAVHSPPIGDFQFPWGAARNLELARQMVQTRKPVVPYEEMIENVAVATAARLSHKRGRAVKLSEVWRGAKR